MSTTTTEAESTSVENTAPREDAAAAREHAIETSATKIYQQLRKMERRKPPQERTKDRSLWTQARRHATREYRSQQVKPRSKQIARNAATSASAELASAVHRNRKQLAPWMLAAPYAATGEAWGLLAEFGSGYPIAISATAAATAAGASILAWRKKLAKRVPSKFRAKTQAGMGMLCGWTGIMPLVDGSSGQAGMALTLAAGTSYMGLSWWRDHDHPLPVSATDDQSYEPTAEVAGASEHTGVSAGELFARQVIADWDEFVVGMGTLPGTRLDNPRRS